MIGHNLLHPAPLERWAGGRARGMDALRLFAASLVIVAHSYALTANGPPLARFRVPELGDIAVGIFFAISGYLVTASWVGDPNLRSFLVRRALRIMPALWVVVLLSTVGLGTLVTTLPLGSYLADAGTWRYLLERSLVYARVDALPGVFTSNPYGAAVNGSLWTLPLEVTAYAVTIVLGLVGALVGRRSIVIVGLAGLVVLQQLIPASGNTANPGTVLFWLVHFGIYYAVGCVLFLYRSRVPAAIWLAVAALGIWAASFGTGATTLVGQVAIPYSVIVLGYRAPSGLDLIMRRIGDLSYGTYIYAFPVQQAIVHYNLGISPGALIASSLPITYLLAWLSWNIVERPALRLRSRLAIRKP